MTKKGNEWPWANSESYARNFRDPRAVAWFLDGIQAGRCCVDVGCGFGEVGGALLTHGASFVVGIDACPAALEGAKERFPLLKTCTAALPDLPYPDGIFDLVVCRNVLHLLEEADRCFNELSRITVRDGLIIVEVPIAETLDDQSILEQLEQRSPKRRFRLPANYQDLAKAHDLEPALPLSSRSVERRFAEDGVMRARQVNYMRFCWRKL